MHFEFRKRKSTYSTRLSSQSRANNILLLIAITFLSCSAFPVVGQKTNFLIQPNYSKGMEYSLETQNVQIIERSAGGQQIKITQIVETSSRQKVLDKYPDGGSLLEIRYNHIVFRSESDAGSISFDTRKNDPVPNPEYIVYSHLPNRPILLHLDKYGWPQKISGMEAILEDALKKSGITPGKERDSLRKKFSRQFGSSALLESLRGSTVVYPDRKIRRNETWRSRFIREYAIPIEIDSEWQLASSDENSLRLDMKAHLKTDPEKNRWKWTVPSSNTISQEPRMVLSPLMQRPISP